ncbi:MAG: hypothetical protein ACI8XO_002760 [Verrucomicrobiales bacterium]
MFLSLTASVTFCNGAALPKGQDWLKKQADAIVTGTNLEVSAETREVKDFGGIQAITTCASKVKIETIEKGEGIGLGDAVTVYSQRHAWKGPGLEPPGHHLHSYTPVTGQRLQVFYKADEQSKNQVLFPNGMEQAEEAEKKKAPGS